MGRPIKRQFFDFNVPSTTECHLRTLVSKLVFYIQSTGVVISGRYRTLVKTGGGDSSVVRAPDS